MAKNRYIGEYPVIGIRPIIDGRRGPMQLRESLEDQVMAMAEAAKKLFEENLYYSNGEPVKVVMADTSIGRVPESAACAEKFKREGVAITLSVTSTAPSGRALCIWPLFWRPTPRRACPPSASTAMRCRTATRSRKSPTT